MCEELGEGAFGKAVKVRRRRDGVMLVAKIMHEEGLSDKAREEVLLRLNRPLTYCSCAGHCCQQMPGAHHSMQPCSTHHLSCI